MRVGYLGPPGTFSEEALLALLGPGAGDAELVPFPSVYDCFRGVREGEVPEALVPIENAIEGSVPQTLDLLAFGNGGVVIRAEVVQPIRHHLIARPGVRVADVQRVLSHPHATAQCQGFLRANLPGVEIVASGSTAEAVKVVTAAEDEAWAAIGTLRAADLYGGEVVAGDIEDIDDNSTRFVLIGTEPAPALGPHRFRTSIVCEPPRDRPGGLLAILQEFALRAVNLTRLESRPAKTKMGRYVFFIDLEGSRPRDLAVDAAIRAIEEQGVARVQFLGSYPVSRGDV